MRRAILPAALMTVLTQVAVTFPAAAATYYVDFTGGDDDRSFAEAQDPTTPWKTWQNFQGSLGSNFRAGDFILFKRGETWRRSDFGDTFKPSAMDGVTFGAYGTGPRPVFDADNDFVGGEVMYVGYNGAASNVLFEGLEFTNSVPKTTRGYLVTAHATSHHLTFRDCYFDATNLDTTLYADLNETFSSSSDYLTIDHCFFYGEPPYNRHAAYSGGQYTVFTNNWVRGFGVSGLKLNGDRCAYGTIAHNVIIDSNVNIMLGETSNADVYGNLSILTADATASTGGTANHIRVEDDDGADGQMPRGNKIYNNTCVGNGDAGIIMYRSRKSGGSFDTWDAFQDNEFRNNLWYLFNEDADFMTTLGEGARYPMPSDYSVFFSDGDAIWRNNGTNYSSISAWGSSPDAPPSLESHSIETATATVFARFVADSFDPEDYRLHPESVAIGAGMPVADLVLNNGGSVTDFFGQAFTSNDIGAIASAPAGACEAGGGETCAASEGCLGGVVDGDGCCPTACLDTAGAFSVGLPIEAEAGVLAAPVVAEDDDAAQGGAYIAAQTDEAGRATYLFAVAEAGDYLLRTLTRAPTISDDSFYVGVDREPAAGVEAQIYDVAVSADFAWGRVSLRGGGTFDAPEFAPKAWPLAAGLHEFTFYGREGGTDLDQVMLELIPGTSPDGGAPPGPDAGDGGPPRDSGDSSDAEDGGGGDGGSPGPMTSGCGCEVSSPGPTGALWALGALLLFGLRQMHRRRR